MRKIRHNQKFMKTSFLFTILLFLSLIAFLFKEDFAAFLEPTSEPVVSYRLEEIPKYSGNPYVVIENNKPNFTEEDYAFTGERYGDLDTLGRCTETFARVGIDTMPMEKRSSIGMIKPTGWHTVKYDSINGKYLYNRCHLIGYQLTGENANPNNLITCTRSMNTVGMLEFENKVAEYVKKTKNHVLYRVKPIFESNHLLANGVTIEASSVEDHCKDICFHVFVYNVQDGIEINYENGESYLKK